MRGLNSTTHCYVLRTLVEPGRVPCYYYDDDDYYYYYYYYHYDYHYDYLLAVSVTLARGELQCACF